MTDPAEMMLNASDVSPSKGYLNKGVLSISVIKFRRSSRISLRLANNPFIPNRYQNPVQLSYLS